MYKLLKINLILNPVLINPIILINRHWQKLKTIMAWISLIFSMLKLG